MVTRLSGDSKSYMFKSSSIYIYNIKYIFPTFCVNFVETTYIHLFIWIKISKVCGSILSFVEYLEIFRDFGVPGISEHIFVKFSHSFQKV